MFLLNIESLFHRQVWNGSGTPVRSKKVGFPFVYLYSIEFKITH